MFKLNSRFSNKDSPLQLTPHQLRDLQEDFRGVKLIVIDEISLMSAGMLSNIYQCLNQIGGYNLGSGNTRPFGGFNIILCGDYYQIPCIPSTEALYIQHFKNEKFQHIRNILLLFNRYIELEEVVRQSNSTFAAALGVLRSSNENATLDNCIAADIYFRNNLDVVPDRFDFPSALAYINTRYVINTV
jgi:hypothetical protein